VDSLGTENAVEEALAALPAATPTWLAKIRERSS
jgi:hypothetical protein